MWGFDYNTFLNIGDGNFLHEIMILLTYVSVHTKAEGITKF